MTGRPRAVVYITRENPSSGRQELLVFDSVYRPEFRGVVPGGGVDPGETFEEAAVREVREETGLRVRVLREIGVAVQRGRVEPDVLHETHCLQAEPVEAAPDEWDHRLEERDGSIETGVVRCRWVVVDPDIDLWGEHRGAFVHALVPEASP